MAGGGDDHDLKLQGPWASPHVLRVRLALGLKGVSYEYVDQEPQDLETEDRSELLLDSSLPVLFHGGERMHGTSLNMVQYLEETFPGVGASLLPDDPSKRAAARYLAAVIDDTLIKAMYKASWGKTDGERAEGKSEAAAAAETLEKALGDQCSSKPFFGGDTAGYVDVALGGLLAWVRAADATHQGTKTFDPAAVPLLAAWANRFGALEAVTAVMPEEAELVSLLPTASTRRSGRWSDYGVYSWLFVSLFLPRVRNWWRSILFDPVDPEEKQMDLIPWVVVTVLSVAFTLWLRPRTRIGLAALFLLYVFAKRFW